MPDAERARAYPAATSFTQHIVQVEPRRTQRRHEPEDDARHERDREREREHSAIDPDLVEPRDFRRPELPEHPDSADREQKPERAT